MSLFIIGDSVWFKPKIIPQLIKAFSNEDYIRLLLKHTSGEIVGHEVDNMEEVEFTVRMLVPKEALEDQYNKILAEHIEYFD